MVSMSSRNSPGSRSAAARPAVAQTAPGGSSNPFASPFHSSFGPTPTAATVTPAAAAGTTAAVESSAAQATTGTAPTAFRPLAFSASTAPSTSTGLFGSTSTATPSTATARGLFGSAAAGEGWIGSTVTQKEFTKSIRFTFEWNPAEVTGSKSHTQTIRSKLALDGYQFECSVRRVESCFLFDIICPTEKDFLDMQWITNATIRSADGMMPNTAVVKRWPENRIINISGPVESNRFRKSFKSMHAVDIILSNDGSLFGTFGVMNSNTVTHSHSDSIMARMLNEGHSHDVLFEFDILEPVSEEWEAKEREEEEKALKSAVDEGISADVNKSADEDKNAHVKGDDDKDQDGATANGKDEHTTTVNAKVKGKGKKKDAGNGGENYSDLLAARVEEILKMHDNPNAHGNNNPNTRTETVGAHKVVLSHFDYFRTMFSGPFAEGGPGIKRIKIRDTDIFCFRLLIEFLYLGQLRFHTQPTVLTEDRAKDHQPTWEDVYLVADRYDVPQLRRIAVERLISGLKSEWAVDFLFRTAYLFEDLRFPVIRFVVWNSMSSIVDKSIQQKYYDHPECSSIFGEIIAELWALRSTMGSPVAISRPDKRKEPVDDKKR